MDLATSYLGLTLKHPLIASSSPLTGEIRQLCVGWRTPAPRRLFCRQFSRSRSRTRRRSSSGWPTPGPTVFPRLCPISRQAPASRSGPHRYLELIRRARAALEIPVIASLNGSTSEGWTDYAKLIQQAGASALELNSFFVPVDAALDGRAVEQRHLDVLRAVKDAVTLPIAVKLSPHFSAVGDLVRQPRPRGGERLRAVQSVLSARHRSSGDAAAPRP